MVTIEESAANRTETVEAKALKWAIEIGGRCIKYIVSGRERRQADVQSLGPGQSDHRVLLIRICGLDGIQRDRSQARGQARGQGGHWICLDRKRARTRLYSTAS